MLLLGKAGGAAAARRTLASTICRAIGSTQVARPRQLRDASPVMRFRPAHQSLINRRYDGRASGPAQYSPKQLLERKPRIRLPATWKGGHESGESLGHLRNPRGDAVRVWRLLLRQLAEKRPRSGEKRDNYHDNAPIAFHKSEKDGHGADDAKRFG